MPIPIRNLYYLFCYAWQRFPEGGAVEVGVDASPDLPNLFGNLLVNGANRLLRRGLDRGYASVVEVTRAPKGRILLDQVVREQTLRRGMVACQFDELTNDVLHNRLIKATARRLSCAPQLDARLRHELRLLDRKLSSVSDLRLSVELFGRVQLSRNSGDYRPVMQLCELITRNALPDQDGQNSRFADVLNDEVQMSKVFEDFLRSFYSTHAPRFKSARAETLRWDGYALSSEGAEALPQMITDITLRSAERIIVMDAKFYRDTLSASFGKPKVKSGNLYQLQTYLDHTALRAGGASVDGILIYPQTGNGPLSLHYRLQGYDVQIVTVDLSQPWPLIHDRLMEIIDFNPARALMEQPALSA